MMRAIGQQQQQGLSMQWVQVPVVHSPATPLSPLPVDFNQQQQFAMAGIESGIGEQPDGN